jgi:hypothetical protein
VAKTIEIAIVLINRSFVFDIEEKNFDIEGGEDDRIEGILILKRAQYRTRYRTRFRIRSMIFSSKAGPSATRLPSRGSHEDN